MDIFRKKEIELVFLFLPSSSGLFECSYNIAVDAFEMNSHFMSHVKNIENCTYWFVARSCSQNTANNNSGNHQNTQ